MYVHYIICICIVTLSVTAVIKRSVMNTQTSALERQQPKPVFLSQKWPFPQVLLHHQSHELVSSHEYSAVCLISPYLLLYDLYLLFNQQNAQVPLGRGMHPGSSV